MALKPTNSCYWAQFLDTGGRSVQGGGALVRAFNRMDINLVKSTLIDHPQSWKTMMCWARDNDSDSSRFEGGYTAMGAAVRMGWTAVLPVLWEAGDRGLGPDGRNALVAATKHMEAACVRKLLDLGMDPNGDEDTRPYSHLLQRNINPDKNASQVRISKAYFAKGLDPWAKVYSSRDPDFTLVEDMLRDQSMMPLRDLLQYAVESGQMPPKAHQEEPHWFWNLFAKATEKTMGHTYWQAWPLHRPVLCDMIRAAHALGLPATIGDVHNATSKVIDHIEKEGVEGPRAQMFLSEWMEICKVFLSLSTEREELHKSLTNKLTAHPTLPGSVVSEWVEAELDRETAAAPVRARPKMRL